MAGFSPPTIRRRGIKWKTPGTKAKPDLSEEVEVTPHLLPLLIINHHHHLTEAVVLTVEAQDKVQEDHISNTDPVDTRINKVLVDIRINKVLVDIRINKEVHPHKVLVDIRINKALVDTRINRVVHPLRHPHPHPETRSGFGRTWRTSGFGKRKARRCP